MSRESVEIDQGDMSNMIEDAESGNEADQVHIYSYSYPFKQTHPKLRAMQHNHVEQLQCHECIFCKLGLDHDERPKTDSSTERTEDIQRSAASSSKNPPKITKNTNDPNKTPVVSHPPPTDPDQLSRNPPDSLRARNSDLDSYFGMDFRATDLLMTVFLFGNESKVKITELAVSAMDELIKMAKEGQPLWVFDLDGKTEVLNVVEYNRQFGQLDDSTLNEVLRIIKVDEPLRLTDLENVTGLSREGEHNKQLQNGLQTEASRGTCVVPMKAIDLVKIFMDVESWSDMFFSIVSRAMVLGYVSTGASENNLDGAIQVITAEFHLPTPLIPVRECPFARYCKQLTHRKWGVVDVSLETIFPNPFINLRRKPSGCLIEELPDGNSKVIWVEHVEADTRMINGMFEALVGSGSAFCAKRWVASMIRQIERTATSRYPTSSCGRSRLVARRENLYKLARRMTESYCDNVTASTDNYWLPLAASGFENVKVTTSSFAMEPGKPPSTVVIVATSIWLPYPMRKVFNFLSDVNSRYKWDILSRCQIIQEAVHFNTGRDHGNCISILRINGAQNKVPIFYLQESCFHKTGSYFIYAPVDIYALSAVLTGGDPDHMVILPSGFAILPHTKTTVHGDDHEEIGGTILTVGFHLFDHNSTKVCIPASSAATICYIVKETLDSIMDALGSPNHP